MGISLCFPNGAIGVAITRRYDKQLPMNINNTCILRKETPTNIIQIIQHSDSRIHVPVISPFHEKQQNTQLIHTIEAWFNNKIRNIISVWFVMNYIVFLHLLILSINLKAMLSCNFCRLRIPLK